VAEVTNELLLEVMKRVQHGLEPLQDGQKDIRNELQAMRGYLNATQADIANIYGKLAGLELHLERIERRLDIIHEPAE
jgi:hypothetical protein